MTLYWSINANEVYDRAIEVKGFWFIVKCGEIPLGDELQINFYYAHVEFVGGELLNNNKIPELFKWRQYKHMIFLRLNISDLKAEFGRDTDNFVTKPQSCMHA